MNSAWQKEGMLFQLVEVSVNSSVNVWKFPRIPNLQDVPQNQGMKAITHFIEVANETQIPFSSTNVALLPGTTINRGYLTLKINNTDQVQIAPLFAYNPANFQGRVRPCGLKDIDWQNSFVNWPLASILPAVASEEILQLQIWYSYYNI